MHQPTLDFLSSYHSDFKKVRGLDSVFVFGSYAIDDELEGFSDIDLGFVVSDQLDQWQLSQFLHTCAADAATHSLKVSPKIYTRSRVDAEHSLFKFLIHEYSVHVWGTPHQSLFSTYDPTKMIDPELAMSLCKRNAKFVLEKLPLLNTRNTDLKTLPFVVGAEVRTEVEIQRAVRLLYVEKVLDTVLYGNMLADSFAYRRAEAVSLFKKNFDASRFDIAVVELALQARLAARKGEYVPIDEKRCFSFIASFPDVVSRAS